MSEKLNPSLVPESTRAIVFDWDDTLVGSLNAKIDQRIFVAKKHYDIELLRENMIKDWGKPVHLLIENWYQTAHDTSAFQKIFETVLSYSKDFPKLPINGASEVLLATKKSGYKLGVVTGSPRNDLLHDFLALGVVDEDFFDYFQASEDSEHHKPDPRVFDPTKDWLRNCGLSPEEVLYIGDSLPDYWAAREAGFVFLGVETGVVDMPTFYRADALSIRAIGDLLKCEL